MEYGIHTGGYIYVSLSVAFICRSHIYISQPYLPVIPLDQTAEYLSQEIARKAKLMGRRSSGLSPNQGSGSDGEL